MKKLLLLFVAVLSLSSCLSDDETQQFHMEFVPVEEVEVPESMTPGHTYEIKVKYRKPSNCHYFHGFYYEAAANTRTIAVQMLYLEAADCGIPTNAAADEATFDFLCGADYASESYIFKFYTGENTDGSQEFMEVVVPIVQ